MRLRLDFFFFGKTFDADSAATRLFGVYRSTKLRDLNAKLQSHRKLDRLVKGLDRKVAAACVLVQSNWDLRGRCTGH